MRTDPDLKQYEEDETGVFEVPEEEPTEEEQERRHNSLILFLLFIRDETRDRLDQLTEALADGKVNVQEWASDFRREMRGRHAEAFRIGRGLAGDMAPHGAEDATGGQAAWDRQEEFFKGFVEDLENGRFTQDGELKEAQVRARARQYGNAIRGTVHESFRNAMGEDGLTWAMSEQEHCKPAKGFAYDCPTLSRMSARPASEWPTSPGLGATPCRNNCGCYWLSADGKYSTEGV